MSHLYDTFPSFIKNNKKSLFCVSIKIFFQTTMFFFFMYVGINIAFACYFVYGDLIFLNIHILKFDLVDRGKNKG